VESVEKSLPELPLEKLKRYVCDLKINAANAKLLYKYINVCNWFEGVLAEGASAKQTANLIIGTIYSTLETEEEKEKFDLKVTPQSMAKLVKLLDDGKINVTLAQITLAKMLKSGEGVESFISENDLKGVDEGELERLCKAAIEANPQAVADFKAGKEKAIFALYGYIKKATQGKADIPKVDGIIKKLLGK
jgi:aspartyl-tRNA(Asn)/glutamyl-tRNA(Gln) amidotransferase subunit B